MPKVPRGGYRGSLSRHGISLRVTIGILLISPATIRLVGNDSTPTGEPISVGVGKGFSSGANSVSLKIKPKPKRHWRLTTITKGRVHSSDEMEQTIIIQIGIVKTLSVIATLVVGAWYAAYRLGRIETKVVALEITASGLTGRVDKLYAGHSPVVLLPKGAKILEQSGLREWITDNMTGLLAQCKTAMDNPYDIQTAAFELFNNLVFPPKLGRL